MLAMGIVLPYQHRERLRNALVIPQHKWRFTYKQSMTADTSRRALGPTQHVTPCGCPTCQCSGGQKTALPPKNPGCYISPTPFLCEVGSSACRAQSGGPHPVAQPPHHRTRDSLHGHLYTPCSGGLAGLGGGWGRTGDGADRRPVTLGGSARCPPGPLRPGPVPRARRARLPAPCSAAPHQGAPGSTPGHRRPPS